MLKVYETEEHCEMIINFESKQDPNYVKQTLFYSQILKMSILRPFRREYVQLKLPLC